MIGVTTRKRRLILTLDRAEKANALTADMLERLVELVREANANPEVSAIILTGAGKTFSAGADLDEVKNGDLATNPLWEELSGAVADSPVFTIAALNGSLAGGAMGMVLACDLRVSVPAARFFYPVLKMGVLPQPSDPARLAALVGPARAKLILLGAARLSAKDAREFGLVDVLDDHPLDAAFGVCETACTADRSLLASIKSMCRPPD